MGTTFDNIPGVGARALWEAIGTEASQRRHFAYMTFHYNEIPFAAARATKVYIRSSAVGDAAGGGGTGTYLDPYLVRHTGDLKALVAALLSGITNLGIIFYDDDVIIGEAANTDQSIVIDWASVSVGRTGDGTRRPEITGFIPVVEGINPAASFGHIGSATGVTGTTHTITPDAGPGITFYWVRGRAASSTDRDDLELIPYRIAATELDCQANDYSFFSDGTTLVINVGPTHSIEMCEITCNTGPGFVFKNFDDNACDDVILGGFGMNTPFTAGGGQALRAEVKGTNTFVARRVKTLWGHYHTSGHFLGASPSTGWGAGGITTWHYCEFGYHLWDQNGGGDGNVCYNGTGEHEYGRYYCTQRRGGLDMTDAYFALAVHATMTGNINTVMNTHGLAAGTPYGHASGGTLASYYFEIGCTYAAESGQTIVNDHMCGSVPAVADKDLQTSYIGGSIDRSVTAMAAAPDGMWGVHESLRLTFKAPPVNTGAYWYLFSSGALKGIFTNLEINIEAQTATWTGKSVRVFNSGTHDFRWIHPRLRITGVNCNIVALMWKSTVNNLNACSIYNGVTSKENGVTDANFNFTDAAGTHHFSEQTPGTGGVLGLAYWGLLAAQRDGLTGVVALAAAATWTTAAGTPLNIRNASQSLPANIHCWRDLLGARRHSTQTLRTLGPIEGIPAGGYIRDAGDARTRECWRP